MEKPTPIDVGLDVHKDSITVALAARYGQIASVLGRILVFAYEAGPSGHGVNRYLSSKDPECRVVAPSLIPNRPGDQVKSTPQFCCDAIIENAACERSERAASKMCAVSSNCSYWRGIH
jgi:transposase